MTEEYILIIPGRPDNMTLVRLAVGAAACSNPKLDAEKIDDIELASFEAFKNICCHGVDGWSRCVEVKCGIDDDKITVLVTDKDDVHDIPKGKRPCLDCPNEGELGIHIIKTIMDKVEFITAAQGSRSIRMVKKI